MRLYLKIVLYMLFMLGLALLADIYFSRSAVTEAMSTQITDAAVSASADLVPEFQKLLVSGNEPEGIKVLHAFGERTGAVYAALVAADGTVIAHTNVALAGTRMADRLMLKAARAASPIFRRVSYDGAEVVDAVIPLTRQQRSSGEDMLFANPGFRVEKAGFLRAGLPLTPARKAEKNIILKLLVLALTISAVVLAFTALFARLILRQISLLREGIRKVREGNYKFSVPVISTDELGEVAASFNKLSRGLSDTTVSKDYLDSVIESTPDPLIITDEAGGILKANRAAAEFSGYDFMPAGSHNLKKLLVSQSEGGVDFFGALSRKGRVKELDLWFLTKAGKRLPVMLSAAFTGGAGGRQLIAVLKDTTQHRESEARLALYLKELETVNARLAEANSELTAFSYSVSHDLRAPLRGIEGFSVILLEEYGPKLDQEARRVIDVIRRNTVKMSDLIEAMLTFSRVSRATMSKEKVDMGALARGAWEETAPAQKAGICRIPALPPAYGDSAMLKQVWLNLFSNALKFTSKTAVPAIEVSCEAEGGFNVYTVRDNGAGFDPAYTKKLFGIFQRLHTEAEFEGTGVGLALSSRVIMKHGGWMKAEGSPGKGAAFHFALPELKETGGGE